MSTPTVGLSPLLLVAIVVTVLAWASAFVVIRGVGVHLGGGELALGRLTVGTVLLSLLLIGRPWVRPSAREWVLILVFGVAWFGAYDVTLNIAEHTLDAGYGKDLGEHVVQKRRATDREERFGTMIR